MIQTGLRTRLSRSLALLVALTMLPPGCGTTAPGGSAEEDAVTGDVQGDGSEVSDELELTAEGRPIGWTAKTHSNDADPDYDMVFPDAKVNRLDITIAAEAWQAMQDNMAELYGTPGADDQIPGGGGQQPFAPGTDGFGSDGAPPGARDAAPEEMIAACDGLAEGDDCPATMGGTSVAGTCREVEGEVLACTPAMDFGSLPVSEWPGGELPEGEMPAGGVPDVGMGFGNGENPDYVPCTVEFEGATWWYVGIRYKGQSSLANTWSSGIGKLPLRFDFDEFEDDRPEVDNQRFFGFKKLSLASNWSDSSYLREKVAHDIFREAGVPAPHTAFYRIYIDSGEGSTYFGLYTMTEIPDDPMLDTQFGDDNGNLYKPTSNWVSFNEEDFDKESNQDEEDWSDVEAAIAALHADRTDAEAWRAGLETALDVDGFLRWLAVNTVIQNWDTYGNMAQNYYLYGNPADDGRLAWIPWDNNMALSTNGGMGGMADPDDDAADANRGGANQGALSLSLDEVNDNWPLIRYLADDPVYWDTYVAYVEETIEGAFAVEPTQARYRAAHDLIAPYVVGEQGEQDGYTFLSGQEEFDSAFDELLEHVAQRREAVLEFLDTMP